MTGTTTWPELLDGLADGHDLQPEESAWAMGQILDGLATPAQVAALAMGLRAKGETVEELSGLADAMLARATPVILDREAVDIVGSGGDRSNTVNISTMAALVAAGAGARVVKHGNRAASSLCGTADCLEALGVVLDVPPASQPAVLEQAGIVFLFAPLYHPSLRHAAPVRRELGIRTAFNFLGPLTNPARPHAQAIGVADERVASLMAGVLARRGSHGMVFHGGDGLDELTTTTTSSVWLIGDGRVERTSFDPRQLGLSPARAEQLVGAGPQHNARVVREVLDGAPGPVREIVLLNAAAALLAHRGIDMSTSFLAQMELTLADAARAVDEGAARATLESFIAATRAA